MYYDIGAYDLSHYEFKEMCLEAWSEKFNCLCIDMTKNKKEGRYFNCNESNTYIECTPETKAF